MRAIFALALFVAPLAAVADEYGTTNPEELTKGHVLDEIRRGRVGMTNCAAGYLMTKSGDHPAARETFAACAEAGYTAAMNWMAQLDNNGLGGPVDPSASAAWSRRSAEAGDPIGKFNYGVDLLRGIGVAQDEAAGRALVDEAAQAGVDAAKRLQAAGYDLDEITPDADDWFYQPGS
jgi:TPR repeat protein